MTQLDYYPNPADGLTPRWAVKPLMVPPRAWRTAMLVGLTSLSTVFAAPAQADPDPHLPDIAANYCPGGNGPPSAPIVHLCEGQPYPDGTRWRDVQVFGPWIGPPDHPMAPGRHCVNADGKLAPPGGCGGGV